MDILFIVIILSIILLVLYIFRKKIFGSKKTEDDELNYFDIYYNNIHFTKERMEHGGIIINGICIDSAVSMGEEGSIYWSDKIFKKYSYYETKPILWHTHPSRDYLYEPPSSDDIISLLQIYNDYKIRKAIIIEKRGIWKYTVHPTYNFPFDQRIEIHVRNAVDVWNTCFFEGIDSCDPYDIYVYDLINIKNNVEQYLIKMNRALHKFIIIEFLAFNN